MCLTKLGCRSNRAADASKTSRRSKKKRRRLFWTPFWVSFAGRRILIMTWCNPRTTSIFSNCPARFFSENVIWLDRYLTRRTGGCTRIQVGFWHSSKTSDFARWLKGVGSRVPCSFEYTKLRRLWRCRAPVRFYVWDSHRNWSGRVRVGRPFVNCEKLKLHYTQCCMVVRVGKITEW